MSVYVITGVSKGIGVSASLINQPRRPANRAKFELVKQISSDSSNLVIGLVRDAAATKSKMVADFGDRANVYILHGDLTSYASLKQAAADATKIAGDRGVDYLIANGAFPSHFDGYDPIGAL